MAIISVQVQAGVVFAPVHFVADGIQAGQEKEFRRGRPGVLLDQFQRGERGGGFVAVDSGAPIDAADGGRRQAGRRWAVQRGPAKFALRVENVRGPAVGWRRRLDGAQHGLDVNPLAVVAVVVFSEFLHAGKFHAKPCRRKANCGGLDPISFSVSNHLLSPAPLLKLSRD